MTFLVSRLKRHQGSRGALLEGLPGDLRPGAHRLAPARAEPLQQRLAGVGARGRRRSAFENVFGNFATSNSIVVRTAALGLCLDIGSP
jgi:hypothetical protein